MRRRSITRYGENGVVRAGGQRGFLPLQCVVRFDGRIPVELRRHSEEVARNAKEDGGKRQSKEHEQEQSQPNTLKEEECNGQNGQTNLEWSRERLAVETVDFRALALEVVQEVEEVVRIEELEVAVHESLDVLVLRLKVATC